MFVLAAAALLCVAAQCTPGGPSSQPTPPVTDDADAPVAGDAGAAPDPISLRLCIDNAEQLNPCRPDTSCLSEAQIIATFCSAPEDLAPWARKKSSSGTP